jgi:putative ABC transport system permease protein
MVREAVRTFGHSLRTVDVTLQSTLVNDALIHERLLAVLSCFFTLVAAVLAGVGLYGVLSYSVVRRTREIGIRVALGARRVSVVRLITSEIGLVTAIGLAAGLAGGEMLARSVSKLLYEVKPTDAASVAFPVACLLGAAAVAALRPAMRAARVDPSVTLREE